MIDSYDRTARLWDLQGNILQVFKGHEDEIMSVAFSPDGKSILTGSLDNTARIWDLQGNLLQVLKGHKGALSSAAFSPDGKNILTGSEDKTTRLWTCREMYCKCLTDMKVASFQLFFLLMVKAF